MDLVHALALAADTDSVLWVDARRLQDEAHPQLAEQVATQLEYNSIPVIVSGEARLAADRTTGGAPLSRGHARGAGGGDQRA